MEFRIIFLCLLYLNLINAISISELGEDSEIFELNTNRPKDIVDKRNAPIIPEIVLLGLNLVNFGPLNNFPKV